MKILKFFMSPWGTFVLYSLAILIFSLIYNSFPASDFDEEFMDFWKSLYFSVITITTLGYGDITPKYGWLMFWTAIEALVGIFIFGLFLNSFWNRMVLQKEKDEQVKKENLYRLKREEFLKYHFESIKDIFETYKAIVAELTSPPLSSPPARYYDYDENFPFSNLSGIFDQSVSNKIFSRYGFFNSRIEIYYEIEDKISKNLNMLKSELLWDVERHDRIRSLINSFFLSQNRYDVKGAIIQKLNKGMRIGGEDAAIVLARHTAEYDTVPDANTPGARQVNETTNLYHGIRFKMECIRKIESEFEKIRQEKDQNL